MGPQFIQVAERKSLPQQLHICHVTTFYRVNPENKLSKEPVEIGGMNANGY